MNLSVPSTPTWPARLGAAALRFVSEPASPRPLAVLRIALAGVLLLQAFALAGNLLDLYGTRGILQRPIVAAMIPDGVPSINWAIDLLEPLGIDADTSVRLVFLVYVGSLACLLLGWRTPFAALAAWLTHLSMKVSGSASIYGVDLFANIALFYCVWMPVGHFWSVDRLAGRVSGEPSALARLGLRVLQIHLCIVYGTSGIEKASGEQWWNGEAIWRAVLWPDMAMYDFTWLAHVPWLALLLCWSTLALEALYPLFIWPRCTRKLWALGVVGMHAGIAVVLGLTSFSAVMIVLNVAAFLAPAETAVASRAEKKESGSATDRSNSEMGAVIVPG